MPGTTRAPSTCKPSYARSVSWSVIEKMPTPRRRIAATSSSGSSVPSLAFVWLWKSTITLLGSRRDRPAFDEQSYRGAHVAFDLDISELGDADQIDSARVQITARDRNRFHRLIGGSRTNGLKLRGRTFAQDSRERTGD